MEREIQDFIRYMKERGFSQRTFEASDGGHVSGWTIYAAPERTDGNPVMEREESTYLVTSDGRVGVFTRSWERGRTPEWRYALRGAIGGELVECRKQMRRQYQ